MINTKWRYFWPALLIGAFAIGPALGYVATLIKFGLGFCSSAAFTTYANEKFITGAVFGGIAAIVCAFNKAEPLRVAGRTATTLAGLLFLLMTFWQFFIRARDWVDLRPLLGSNIIDIWTIFFISYLTAVLTRRWLSREPEASQAMAKGLTSAKR